MTETLVTSEKLEKAHQILFDMLCEIDSILKQTKVRYILGFGTLLGAVRHQDFIPWDDDVDLFVCDEDYDEALKILTEKLNVADSNYLLQYGDTDPNYWRTYAVIRHRGSKVLLESKKSSKFNYQGLWVSLLRAPLMKRRNLKLWMLIREVTGSINYNRKNKKGLNVFKYFIGFALLPMLKAVYGIVDIASNAKLRVFPGWKEVGGYYSDEDVFPLAEQEFRGRMFPVPRNYDRILTEWYGDYWQLPPITDRRIHLYDIEYL